MLPCKPLSSAFMAVLQQYANAFGGEQAVLGEMLHSAMLMAVNDPDQHGA